MSRCDFYEKKYGRDYCCAKSDYITYKTYNEWCYDDFYAKNCPICKSYKDKNRNSSGNGNGSGCFITTACISELGCADDCYELTTLRHFRDTYVSLLEGGKSEVEEYYRYAPEIVQAINKEADSHSIYHTIYDQMIKPSLAAIEAGEFKAAYDIYKSEFLKLKGSYGLQ